MIYSYVEVSRFYSTRVSKKNLLMDVMKGSKSSTNKKRKLRKAFVVEKVKNIDVVEVGEGKDIKPDVVATTVKL